MELNACAVSCLRVKIASLVSSLCNIEIEESDKESKDSFLNTVETENSDEEQRETVEEDDEDDLFSALN